MIKSSYYLKPVMKKCLNLIKTHHKVLKSRHDHHDYVGMTG